MLALSTASFVARPVPMFAQNGSPPPGERPPPSARIDPELAPRPAMRAFPTEAPIAIDGRLDETAWQTADSATQFVQTLPREGYPPSEPTVVRVLYDERNLYIGAELYDSQPEALVVSGLEQDFRAFDSDAFSVAIDPYLDRQTAFIFTANPAGAIFDAQGFNDSRYVNSAWEGVIHVKTRVHDEGWTVEMAIPFTTLRFKPTEEEQTWGINFRRGVRRHNEHSYWSPLSRQFNIHKMSRAGMLTGLRGLRQGRNLTFKPYVSAVRQVGELRSDDDRGNDVDGGFDLKYGVTPRLTLDVTALTDFSQVEVDQEQVNLTRFSLFFPEKRDFFMENAGVFTFGDRTENTFRTGSSDQDFTLFHSRRIGLSEDRLPIPIGGGLRLTGRAGPYEIGVLEMQTRTAATAPAENFAVARVRRSIFGRSDIGFMVTNRQGTGEDAIGEYNRSVGVDVNLRPLRHMMINSYVATTEEPNETGNSHSAWLQVAWRDPVWDASGFVKHVGDAFNPDAGFVRRTGVRQAFGTVGAHPQPRVPFVQEINPYVDVSFISDLDWILETRQVTGGVGMIFLDGGRLTLEYTDQFERLADPTTIVGVEVAAGEYRFREGAVTYRATGARWISGELRMSHGGFFDGDRTSIAADATIRPDFHLSVDVQVQHNAVTLADSSFTADLYGARLRYAYSTRHFASAFVQYNVAADELVTNLRFNFIHAPLSDFFLVYTERRDMDSDLVLDRVITAKVTKLLAF